MEELDWYREEGVGEVSFTLFYVLGVYVRFPLEERTKEFYCILKSGGQDFPESTVVKTPPSNAGGVGQVPGQGAKLPHDLGPKKKHKTKNRSNIVTNTKKMLKMVHTRPPKIKQGMGWSEVSHQIESLVLGWR